jgi:hypothetical protein
VLISAKLSCFPHCLLIFRLCLVHSRIARHSDILIIQRSGYPEDGSADAGPSAGVTVGTWSSTPQLLDILSLSFVFIDILALFRRYCSPGVEGRGVEKPTGVSRAVTGTCVGSYVLPLNSSTPQLLDFSTFVIILCFHRHPGFVSTFFEFTRGLPGFPQAGNFGSCHIPRAPKRGGCQKARNLGLSRAFEHSIGVRFEFVLARF